MHATAEPQAIENVATEFVPIEAARALLGPTPIAKQTVLALAVRGEIEVRAIAGRFVATRSSIDGYRRRRGLDR